MNRPSVRLALGALVVLVIVVAFTWATSNPLADPQPDVTPGVIEPAPAPAPDPAAIPANATAATVNYVHDGDTLFLSTPSDSNLKVRLLAVDTPEIGDNLECFGNESTNFLRTLAPEGSIVYTVADVEPLDQYGRSLLFVYTASGELINLSLVQQGYAEAVFIGDNRMFEQQFEQAEDQAQQSAAGVWGNC